MRSTIARLLLLPLLLAGCQQAAAAPSAPAPSAAATPVIPNAANRPKVGILVFDGVQIIDYSGPFEVFGQAGFDVFTVAEQKDPVTTAMGQVILPSRSFAEAAQLDILVVPGGEPRAVTAAQDDPEVKAFVQAAQPRARHIMSVCNGAFILAKAGLLDGKGATTFHGLLKELQATVPSARVVNDKRFVDNGQVITTAGLTAGMDGALHILAEELSMGMAQQVALGLEYDWRPDTEYARATFADMHIMHALSGGWLPQLATQGALRIDRTEGDAQAWTMVMGIQGQGQAGAVMTRLASELAAAGWRAAGPEASNGRSWTFADDAGRPWTGTATTTDAADGVRVELRIKAGG